MHPVSLAFSLLRRAQKAEAQPITEFPELMHFALFAPPLPRTQRWGVRAPALMDNRYGEIC
ncbi:MAG: hypothetical protein WAK26_15130, partial [Terracidiphilus sp.]